MTQLIDAPVAYEQTTDAAPLVGVDDVECALYAKTSFEVSQEGESFVPLLNTEISPSGIDFADSPEVRHEKIAVLQAAIANGTYHVSAAALADKLIESMFR